MTVMLGVRNTLQRVFSRKDPNEPQPKQMDLGKSGGFHYDKTKGEWVIEGEERKDDEFNRPPPMPVTVQKPDKPRSRYVDPLASDSPAPFTPAGASEDNGTPASAPVTTTPAEQVIASYEFQAIQEELLRKVEDLQAALTTQRNDHLEEAERHTVEREGLEAKVDMLTSDKAKAYMQVRELEFELKSEKEERVTLETQIAQLKRDLGEREKEIVALRVTARTEDPDPASSITDPAELHVRLIQSDTEKANLLRILSEKDSVITDLRDQLETQMDQTAHFSKDIDRVKYDYQLTLAFKDEEAGRLTEQLERARLLLGQTRELHRQAQEQLERLLSQREEYEIRVSILSQAKSKADIEIRKAVFDREQAELEGETAWRQVRDLQSQVRGLEEQLVKREEVHGADFDVEALIEAHMQMQTLEAEKLSLQEQLLALRRTAQETEDTLRHAVGEETRYLRKQLEQTQHAAETQRNELQHAGKVMRDCEHERDALKSHISAKEQEIAALKTHYANRETELTAQINAKEQEISALKTHYANRETELTAHISAKEQEISALKTHCVNRETDLNAQISHLHDQAKLAESSIRQLQDTHQALLKEHTETSSQLQTLFAEKQQLQAELLTAQNSLETAKISIETANNSLEIAKNSLEAAGIEKLNESESRTKMCIEEIAILNGKLINLRSSLDSHNDRFESCDADYARVAQEMGELRREKDQLEVLVSSLKSDLTLANDRFEDQTVTIASLKEQIEGQRTEIDTLSTLKMEIGEELLASQTALSEIEEELHRLRCEELGRVPETAPDLVALVEEVEELRSALSEAQQTAGEQSEQISQLQEYLRTLKTEKTALIRTNSELQAQLDQIHHDSFTHQHSVADLQSRLSQHQTLVSQLQSELASVKEHAVSTEDTASGLQFQIHKLDKELMDVREKYTEIKRQNEYLQGIARDTKDNYEEKVRSLEDEIERINAVSTLESEKIKSNLRDMEEETNKLELELNEVKSREKELVRDLKLLKNSHDQAVSLNQQLAETVKSLEKHLQLSQNDIKNSDFALQETIRTLQKEKSDLEMELNQVKEELGTVSMELEAEKTELEATKTDFEELQSNFSSLNSAKIDLETEKTQEIQKFTEIIEKLQTENDKLRVNLTESREISEQKMALQLDELEKSLQEKTSEVDKMQLSLSELSSKCAKLASDLSHSESERLKVEKSLSSVKTHMEQMKKHYEELILRDRATATEAFEAQSRQLAAKEAALAQLQLQFNEKNTAGASSNDPVLQRKIQELNENIEELYEKNFTLQQEAAVAQKLAQEKQQLLEEIKKLKEEDSSRDLVRRREEELQILKQELMASMERLQQPRESAVLEPVTEAVAEAVEVLPPMTEAQPKEERVEAHGWFSGFLSAVFLTEKERD